MSITDITHFIGAGLRDAKIKVAGGTLYDIYGIVTVGGDSDRNEVEIKGDDVILGTFTMGLKEKISIEANAISFDVIQAITGNTISSSATGSEIALGTDSEMNPPVVEVQAFTAAKSGDDTASVLKKTWYKVQLTAIKVEMSGENEFKFSAEGTAYPTDTDVTGAALATTRISDVKGYAGTIA